MCLPSDRQSLLMWLRTQISVIQAWRDAALLEGADDAELCQLLSDHHVWLADALATLGASLDAPCAARPSEFSADRASIGRRAQSGHSSGQASGQSSGGVIANAS